MSRKKLLIIIIFIFSAFFILGTLTIGKNTDPFTQTLKSLIPEQAKTFLKKTIFVIPMILQKNDQQDANIKRLFKDIGSLKSQMIKIDNKLAKIKTREILSESNNKYELLLYRLNLPNHYDWGLKPVAYVEQSESHIFLSSGNGNFLSIEKRMIGSEKLQYELIDTNIKNLISDEQFYGSYVLSIKDLFIRDNKIYFSFGNLLNKCFHINIFRSDLSQNFLKFEKFFTHKECKDSRSSMNYQHIGGRIVSYKDNQILLSVGDFGDETTPQDKNSIFGKIISINLMNKDFEIISMGSRNAQGLYYDVNDNVILNTEHGPTGGDEININNSPDTSTVENYGWPVVSYGTSGEKVYPTSHKKFGFIEPIKHFTPSIGISEISRVPKKFNHQSTNDFFINALGFKGQIAEGDQSIHHIRLNEDYSKIIFEDVLPIGERIRDSIYLDNENSFLLVLETIPALGFLKLKK